MQLGREVFEDYEVEDIIWGAALDCWHYGLLTVYENNMTNTIVLYQFPTTNIYIPTRSGTGKVVRIIKREYNEGT